MQKLVWCTGFFVSIVLAQSDYCFLPDDSPVLHQSAVLPADSTVKIIGKPSDEVASDVLQENLYTQILSEINNPQHSNHTVLPENKYQLLI